MAIGWLTDLSEANAYFATQRLESAYWDALTALSGQKDMKTAVLTQAYNRLRRCKDFAIPSAPTAAELVVLKEAQLETAYYLAQHLRDEDARKGRQAQGVQEAGAIKEVYAEAELHKLPLPPIVYEIMEAADLVADETHFYALPLGRDENKELTEDPEDD